VLVIGDTPKDIAAARAARAIGVGVASRQLSQDELGEAGTDYVSARSGRVARHRQKVA
jgi:phosphoglycolate phosphatase-like HAD superfamily hydrolase